MVQVQAEMGYQRKRSIQTHSGRMVDPFHIVKDDVVLNDIAHALANKCRYNGHSNRFYSVAEHSVYISRIIWRMTGDKQKTLAALFHDAGEYVFPDIPAPYKPYFVGFKEWENKALQVIFKRLEIDWPPDPLIKTVDLSFCYLVERHKVFSYRTKWDCVDESKLIEVPNMFINFFEPKQAKGYFLSTYEALLNNRHEFYTEVQNAECN
jgi:hypothetical protein